MRSLLVLLGVFLFLKGYPQTATTKNNNSNTIQFDTIKIDKVSYTVYQNWRNVISAAFELDSQYVQKYYPNRIYSRSKKGEIFCVKDKTEYYLAERYKGPGFYTEIIEKSDFLQFFKNAPKGGFNPGINNNDTLSIKINYFRQQNKDDKSKSELYNKGFITSELELFYKHHGIETDPKTAEEANANQAKLKILLDSCYIFPDFVVSNNANHTIVGIFETDQQRKKTSLTLYSISRYTDFGPSDISIQYFLRVSTNRILSLTVKERKDWFAYFLPVIKNIKNEQIDPMRKHQ